MGFPHDFNDIIEEESEEEDNVDSNNDGGSLQSERTDKDEETSEGALPVAAQDLTSVSKAGYLEKRRKDHSFFGTEWQRRWCALSLHTFYYYGSDKDKQQKGEFDIDGYSVKKNPTLRKDSKKDCCFEISAPDKRVYQFCASSVKEADEWVKEINFVLKDMTGIIPEDEDEDDMMYDDVGQAADTGASEPIDEDIYEELPEEDEPTPAKPLPAKPSSAKPASVKLPSAKPLPVKPFQVKPSPKVELNSKPPAPAPASAPAPAPAVDKSTDYKNFYQGLWDCTGDHPDELSFKRGDAVYILSKEYSSFGWWVGEKNGAIGIVPKEYLIELYAL